MVATIWVAVFVVIAATAVPPMVTPAVVAPLKFVPFITILAPVHPVVLPSVVIVGNACTVVVLFTAAVPQVLVLKCTNKSLVLPAVTVTDPLPKPSTVPLKVPTLTVIISVAALIVKRYLLPVTIPVILAYSPS